MTPGRDGHVAGALPFPGADSRGSGRRQGSSRVAGSLRTLDGPVDRGADCAEQFGELCGGVLAGGVQLDEVRLLFGVEFGLLAASRPLALALATFMPSPVRSLIYMRDRPIVALKRIITRDR
jgi:hypothetical protein